MQMVYLNDLSFSCASKEEAVSLFLKSFNEVLIALGDTPRACFFHKNESFRKIQLGNNISCEDILDSVKYIDRDIYTVLLEFEDKNYKELSDRDMEQYLLQIKNPSIQGIGINEANDFDLILLASYTHSILMSLNTAKIWSAPNIVIHYYEDEQCSKYQSMEVGNISDEGHGQIWRNTFIPQDLRNLPCNFGNYTIKIFPREHGKPHFHLCHRGNKITSIDIETLEVIAGKGIPKDAIEAVNCAKEHQDSLRILWKENAQPGFTFYNDISSPDY